MAEPLNIRPATTALVAIDLQNGIVGRLKELDPSSQVVPNSVKLADALRAAGGTVVWVNVDVAGVFEVPVDQPWRPPGSPPPPASAMELVPNLNVQPGDLRVTKRQWGAFYGTTLEQDLRRRGIRTIILTGVSTNAGVESTARAAFDQNYALIFAEDAMASSMGAAAHAFTTQQVFPRMGRVRSTQQIVDALRQI